MKVGSEKRADILPGVAGKALQKSFRKWEFPGKMTLRRNGKRALYSMNNKKKHKKDLPYFAMYNAHPHF